MKTLIFICLLNTLCAGACLFKTFETSALLAEANAMERAERKALEASWRTKYGIINPAFTCATNRVRSVANIEVVEKTW